jgi:hypothetical protein
MQLKGAKVFAFDTLAREKSLSIGHISKGKSFFCEKSVWQLKSGKHHSMARLKEKNSNCI